MQVRIRKPFRDCASGIGRRLGDRAVHYASDGLTDHVGKANADAALLTKLS